MQANFNLWTEIRGQRRMADLLVEVMNRAGVTHAFAMPAESLNPIVDAIRKNGQVKLITVRHEGNGALMASACAKLTGKLSVCMGAAGPGASHLPLGTYDAKADGVPMLAVSGQVPIHQVGSGGFQEINSVDLFDDSVVFNRLVASPRQCSLLSLACAEAIHRRAPVHLAFPSDVLGTRIDPHAEARLYPEWLVPGQTHDKNRIREAAARLSGRGGALLIVGGGVDDMARVRIESLAEKLQAPICIPYEGIHYLRQQPNSLAIRMSGRPEDPAFGLAQSASRIIIIGIVGSSVYSRLPSSASKVQIGPLEELGRPENGGCFRLLGDVAEILGALLEELAAVDDPSMLERAREVASEENKQTSSAAKDFWSVLNRVLPADAILAIEPGPIFESAFFNLCLRGRTVTTSFNHQVRGYAFPAAFAATLVHPSQPVWAIASPSGLAGSMADFLSAQKYSVPIKTICFSSVDQGDATGIDLCGFARACGYRVSEANNPASLAETLSQTSQKDSPMLVSAIWPNSTAPQPRPYEVRSSRLAAKPARRRAADQTFAASLIEALNRAGISRIYGTPRASAECLVEKLREDGRIRFLEVTYPESAAMMASAYSKWTGRVGVCLAIDSGDIPFQLNGLYDAALDRNPMIILTACGSKLDRHGADPNILDVRRLLKDIVAASDHIGPEPETFVRLQHSLRKAIHLRSVTHVCFDTRKLNALCPSVSSWFDPLSSPETLLPLPDILSEAIKRLSRAKRPVMLVGRGAQGCRKEILELASVLSAPVVSTMPGRGIIPDDSELYVGGIGASGHRAAIDSVRKSDVLLVVGSSNRGAVYGLEGKFFLIQIDSDPRQLGQRRNKTLGLYGTTRETLQRITHGLAVRNETSAFRGTVDFRRPALHSHFVREHRNAFVKSVRSDNRIPSNRTPIPPAAICHTLVEVLNQLRIGRPIVTVDVGVTTLWVYRYLVGNFDFIWTSSYATMGFAVPAAIAIRELEPSRPVIAIAGDGGIGITMPELATAARLKLPIVVIVFNNGKLSAIKYEQEVMGWPEYESALFNCDFAQYARACGAHGIRVTRIAQLADALRSALTCGAPCVVDVVCDPDAMPAPPRIHPLQASGYLLAISREFRDRLRKSFRGSQHPS